MGAVCVRDSTSVFFLVSFPLHPRRKSQGSVHEGEEHWAGPGKIVGRGGMGGDNDREGLNSQDKERGMYWGTWPVLSRPVQLNMGGLALGVLEVVWNSVLV